jgi:hypothetical protein
LRKSGLHNTTATLQQHKDLLDIVEVKMEMIEAEDWERWSSENPEQAKKRQRSSGNSSGEAGGSSSGHNSSRIAAAALGTAAAKLAAAALGASAIVPQRAVAMVQDNVTIPRTTLATMCDQVDRCVRAAYHAVSISQQARNAFEEEHRRLTQISGELRNLANSGSIV